MSATRRPATWLICAWFAMACVSKTAVTDGAHRDNSVDSGGAPRVLDLLKDPPLLEGRVLVLKTNGGEPRATLTIRVRPGTTQSLQITNAWLPRTSHLLVTVGAAVGSGLLTYDFLVTEA